MKKNVTVVVLLAVLLGLAGTAQAAYQLVDDFAVDTVNTTVSGAPAPIGGVWGVNSATFSGCSALVVTNTTGSGPANVLQLSNSSGNNGNVDIAYLPLQVPANTPNYTLFFQVYCYSSSFQAAAGGLSRFAIPTAISNFAGYDYFVTATTSGAPNTPYTLARNAGANVTLLTGTTTPAFAGGQWYDVWQVYHTGSTAALSKYDTYIGDQNGNLLASATGLSYRTEGATNSMNTLAFVSYPVVADVGNTTMPALVNFANVFVDSSHDNHLSTPFTTSYTVTLNQATGGSIAVSPIAANYADGTQLTITATPSSGGWHLVNWVVTGAGSVSGNTGTDTLTVNGNVILSAVFTAHNLTAATIPNFASNQTVVAVGNYTTGATQTVTTAPNNSNYVFSGWIVSDSTASVTPATSTTATFTMGQNDCLLTAVYNVVINRVPLNISSGFNMNCFVGPVTVTQATLTSSTITNWIGGEGYGGATYWTNQAPIPCDTSSYDGLAVPDFLYRAKGHTAPYWQNGASDTVAGYITLSGSQGMPENGIIYSVADTSNARTYVMASVSGNYLMPGNWADPVYDDTKSGTVVNSPYVYSINNYTFHNGRRNAILTGLAWGASPAWSAYSVTTTLANPGYYSDVNFVLAGVANRASYANDCEYNQIWANYADKNVVNNSTSLKLYDWTTTGSLPCINLTNPSPNFTLVYTVAADIVGSAAPATPRLQAGNSYLWEFTNPLTIDKTRVLVGFTMIVPSAGAGARGGVAYFAATASASVTASNTLVLNQTTGGTVSVSQSGVKQILAGYPYGAKVKLTASNDISQGYHFGGWNIVGNGTVDGTTGLDTLTIYGPVTVSAIFAADVSYSSTTAITGGGTISVPSGTYSAGQVITISATATQGFTFVHWLVTGTSALSDQNASTTTLTVNSNFTLTAVFAVIPAQLQLSGGFNEQTIIGPIVASQATAHNLGPLGWIGYTENSGYDIMGYAGRNGAYNSQANGLFASASASDGLPGLSYQYYLYQNNVSGSYTYAGNKGLPENGTMASTVDGRNYLIASVSGNTLLPGDWTEAAFDITKSGNVVSGTGTAQVIYGSTTYTASNPKFNTLVVGQNSIYTPSWVCASLTATFTPGYYADINFAMKASGYGAAPNYYGAAGTQIVANYSTADANGSTSQLLYGFTAGEMTLTNSNAANFRVLYTALISLQDQGTRTATNINFPTYLYEFSLPRTLDATRQLTGITLTYDQAGVYAGAQLAVYGATANPATPGFLQLDTAAVASGPLGVEGTITSPASGNFYAYGSSLTVTATPATGYQFANWLASDPNATFTDSTLASTTLTLGSSNCVLTASFSPQVCTLAVTTSGNGTATANVAGPYYYGQVVPISITPSIGWQLSSETLVNCTYATNSLTLLGNATAQFNFTQINYTVSGKALYLGLPGGGTVSWSPTGTQHYGTVVTYSETPAQYYYLVGWTMSGTGTFDTNNATSTTVTAQVLTSNLTMTASFNLIAYTETGSPSAVGEGSATISPTPAGGFTPGNGQNVAIITATASDGWVFSYWSLPPGSIDSITPSVGAANYMTHLYVYDNNYLPTADFVVITSTLTTNPSDSGTVTLDGAASTTGTIGQVINLVATAAPGYTFSYWTVTATDSDSVAYVTIDFSSSVANQNAANTTLTIPDFGPVDLGNAPITDMNLTVTANFVVSGTGVQTFSVTINQTTGGNVTITGGPSYNSGDTPTITATPSAGYSFTSWNVLGDTAANVSPTTLDPINADVTLSANFALIDYSDTLTQVGGTITIPAGPYTYGEVLVIQANPDAGFHFSGWSVTGPSTLSDSAALTTSLTVLGDFDLSAEFTADTYNVTLVQPSGGTIGASSLTASYNQVVTLSQTPAGTSSVFQGYLVTSGTSQITGGDLLTVTGDVTVTGSYTAETFSATAVTSTNWVYQNTRVTTADRHQIHLTVNMVDTWGNTSYTATVSQTGPGVVTPALTWVSGTTVTPTGAAPVVWTVPASTTFSGYLLGGRVSGAINSTANLNLTGNCTLTVRVQGNVSGPANLATTPTVTIFVRPLGGMAGANSVTTTDKNDLNSRLNGGLLGWDPNIWNLDGISGPTTTQKNILNTLLNGATLQ